MYAKIINPVTGKKETVTGKSDKRILINYINALKGGDYTKVVNSVPNKVSDYLSSSDKLSVKKTQKHNLVSRETTSHTLDLESDNTEWEALISFYGAKPKYIFKWELYNPCSETMIQIDGDAVIKPNIEKLIRCSSEGAVCELHIEISKWIDIQNVPKYIIFDGIQDCLTLRKIRVYTSNQYAYGTHVFPSFVFPSITSIDILPELVIEVVSPPIVLDKFLLMSPEYLHLNNSNSLSWLLNKLGNEIIIKHSNTYMFTTLDSPMPLLTNYEIMKGQEGTREEYPIFDEELIKIRRIIDICLSGDIPIKIIIEQPSFTKLVDINNCSAPGVLTRATHCFNEQFSIFRQVDIDPWSLNILTEIYGFTKKVPTEPDWWEYTFGDDSYTYLEWISVNSNQSYEPIQWILDPLPAQ